MKQIKITVAVFLTALFLLVTVACAPQTDDRTTVTVTFYPVYVAAANVLDGIDSVRLECLTAPTAGCLHDYQLSPGELIRLNNAGVIIANGGGMESFLDKVLDKEGVRVTYACEGVTLKADNAHAWLDVQNYIVYVHNILAGVTPLLSEADAAKATANAEAYITRLETLDAEIKAATATLSHKEIVTFHEAFDYFADAYGLTVLATVENEPGEEPTPEEMTAIVEKVNGMSRKVLFTEPQYETASAETIARETGASIFVLDPIVTGELEKGVYETVMRTNIRILTEALN